MAELDPFSLNIGGVQNLVSSSMNKADGEAVPDPIGPLADALTLDMEDDELIALARQRERNYAPYEAKIKVRQKRNRAYYAGLQGDTTADRVIPVASNLIFEAQETFIPQALAKNPEPVVWSDNTEEGKEESNKIKTMLQYHADTLVLSRIMAVMIRDWSTDFIAVVKHGWDAEANDITLERRKPSNFIFDVDGYVDVKGHFKGWLGERITCSAGDLIDRFPEKKEVIYLKVDGKLGTQVTYTEFWDDDMCFTIFEDEVLDKHKNEFWNYGKEEDGLSETGEDVKTATPGLNHFPHPQKPYTFLSVFSTEDQPHDITTLIEQNINNQNRIIARDEQIDKNLRAGNNSLICDPAHFDIETARLAANAVEDGDPVLGDINGIKRLPASPLPSGILEAQQEGKNALRGIFGVQGIASQPQTSDTTARGMILNQSHDSSRIGGGIGDALEQVADRIFNFWLQQYYVFYDEKHYGAIIGNGQAVGYVELLMSDTNRQFVVSVSPNSMAPKDEISERNTAIELANSGWLDPINLFKKLDYPDPMETAKMVTMYQVNKQQYFQTYFPEVAQQQMGGAGVGNPPDMGVPPSGQVGATLAEPPTSPGLEQVPLSAGIAQPQ